MVSNVFKLKQIAEDVIKQHATKFALKKDFGSSKKNKNEALFPERIATTKTISTKSTNPDDKPDHGSLTDNKQEDFQVTTSRLPTQIPTDELPVHHPDIFTHKIKEASEVFETKYNFHECKNGVCIEGPKPRLIYLDEDLEIESARAATVMSKILEFSAEESMKTTVICKDLREAYLTLFGFNLSDFGDEEYCKYIPFLMNRGVPSIQDKKKVWERCCSQTNSCDTLVTDFQGFRGCETEICILFIDPDELYSGHIMVEVLARAVTNLVAIILPKRKGAEGSAEPQKVGNFRQVLDAWIEEKAVDVYRVKTSKNAFTLEDDTGETHAEGEFLLKHEDEFKQFKLNYEKEKGNYNRDPRRLVKSVYFNYHCPSN